jgi:hypothetical protein
MTDRTRVHRGSCWAAQHADQLEETRVVTRSYAEQRSRKIARVMHRAVLHTMSPKWSVYLLPLCSSCSTDFS